MERIADRVRVPNTAVRVGTVVVWSVAVFLTFHNIDPFFSSSEPSQGVLVRSWVWCCDVLYGNFSWLRLVVLCGLLAGLTLGCNAVVRGGRAGGFLMSALISVPMTLPSGASYAAPDELLWQPLALWLIIGAAITAAAGLPVFRESVPVPVEAPARW